MERANSVHTERTYSSSREKAGVKAVSRTGIGRFQSMCLCESYVPCVPLSGPVQYGHVTPGHVYKYDIRNSNEFPIIPSVAKEYCFR